MKGWKTWKTWKTRKDMDGNENKKEKGYEREKILKRRNCIKPYDIRI